MLAKSGSRAKLIISSVCVEWTVGDRAAAPHSSGIAVNFARVIVTSILLGLAPLLLGCGHGKGPERLPIHGTLTLPDGEKLNGSITFNPAKGQPGPSAFTKVADGIYKFDRSNGPTAGRHDVIVNRVIPRASTLESIAKRQPIEKKKNQWTSAADVLDDGKYLQDLKLE